MNNILKYNSIVLKYIIIFSLILLLVIVLVKMYYSITKEAFSQISLEKQVSLYNDYRNYIEGKDYLISRFRKGRKIPYTVNKKCFQKEYSRCINEEAPYAIADPLICQDVSYNHCYE